MELYSQVCDFCWMTEYTSLQDECNACQDHVDIHDSRFMLIINVKLFQEMMVQHIFIRCFKIILKMFTDFYKNKINQSD